MQSEHYGYQDCKRLNLPWTCPPNAAMLRVKQNHNGLERKMAPEVVAARASRLKLEAKIKELKETAEAEFRTQALSKKNSELKARLAVLQAEADRRSKGGFQSRIRTGEFSKSRFKVSLKT